MENISKEFLRPCCSTSLSSKEQVLYAPVPYLIIIASAIPENKGSTGVTLAGVPSSPTSTQHGWEDGTCSVAGVLALSVGQNLKQQQTTLSFSHSSQYWPTNFRVFFSCIKDLPFYLNSSQLTYTNTYWIKSIKHFEVTECDLIRM